ncbi:OmpA family protein [Pseudoteredinibacter isoporae]|uniref:Peptidoglycan-associated lipoprotein n=1 Tax=Pseudoteredinibacter isoporae TaxID=570281 RepID=A0A7X0JX42_9GAMM|nr:OmpA family protein [Pseudoteredinibacter isoporae]MBB6522891.1 peptidoglycan-associated lipoprotein [Pseudoteredinibacter isoporae]NHO88417.1 OmpA family protein [Pseudoteredinibacter isoporae]NIB23252.1 OmpA family protein [Pseudoteredinibacter isoporae]
MTLKTIKNSLGLAFILAAMAGCSSTGTSEDANANANGSANGADSGVATGTADSNGLSSGDNSDAYAELDTVFYFDFDQSLLRPESRTALTGHAARLKASGDNVRLEGHADDRGTREYNMALGERRANAVRDFLLLQGVNASQLETVSYGEERPAQDGTSDYARGQNRRVELK